MADSVLYFPSIRPPENEWFTSVLLYWDRVGIILPQKLADDHVFLRPYTSALLKEELLEPVLPTMAFWYTDAGNHFDAFLNLVDNDPLVKLAKAPTAQRQWVHVHLNKIGSKFAKALVERKLAKDPSDDPASMWIDVERRTANLLMAYLAVLVCQDQSVGMDPITDSPAAIDAFKPLPDHDRLGTERQSIRFELLRDILPAPAGGIEPARLAEFKEDHKELLTTFRRRVEAEAIQCAGQPDDRDRAALMNVARNGLKQELTEIEERMKERRWTVVWSAVGVVAAALTVADLAFTGGTLATAASSLGLVAAVDQAFRGQRRSAIFDRPLAFAAFARRELGS